MGFWGFPRYVCKAEKQAKAARKLEQLKKKRDVKPVILQGGAIARTWWGRSWNQNLERYADYSNRIGRGRSYVRHGAVLDLQISAGEVRALVQGSRSKPYEIAARIKKLSRKHWQQITASCSGMLDSLPELLAGNFPKELGELFLKRDAGLFPSPKEITFECSCPDWASMCKHVAATLYGVGARLDEDATLFFTLRGVDVGGLISRTVSAKAESLLEKASKKSSRIIDDADLTALFGIDLAGKPEPAAIVESKKNARDAKVAKTRRSEAKDAGRAAADVQRKKHASKIGVIREQKNGRKKTTATSRKHG